MSAAADWLSVAEAARRLDVDRHTLYDAAARVEVPARRVGRSVRVLAWWVDSGGPTSGNGHSVPDAQQFAADFARAVAVELGRLLSEALARATAPAETGAVLDLDTRDHIGGRYERTG